MYDTDLMIRIARMYYEKNMSQQEIADVVYVSRSMVSRMIKQARDIGIVEINIKSSFENYYKLENQLKNCFPNCEMMIAYSENSDLDEEFDSVCGMGSYYIENCLNNNSVFAVARGKTVANTVSMLKPDRNFPDMQIVQLTGSLSINNPNCDEMNNAQKVQTLYGCKLNRFFAPYLMEDKNSKNMICKHQTTAKALEMGKQTNIFISGVDSLLFWKDYLEEKDFNNLTKNGAIGCMCGYFFDINGNIVETSLYDRAIIPDRNIFKKVDKRICIANDRFKLNALLGALRGELCNVLITNSKIATRLLEMEKSK